MKSIKEDAKQEKMQRINAFNTIMGLMGQTTPLAYANDNPLMVIANMYRNI